MLTSRAPSLNYRIRTEIEAKILRGDWPPGHRLPTEVELQAQYGCARATISNALASLADAGLLERRKRAGTIVAHQRSHAPVLNIPDIADLVAGRGAVYRFDLRSRLLRQSDSDAQDERRLNAPGLTLALVGIHFADASPFALERRLISLVQVPDAERADFTAQAPGTWLLSRIPWTKARHRIAAVGCARADAGPLSLSAGAPCLQLDRWTWRNGQGVTFVRQIFPASNYDLSAEFTPNSESDGRRPISRRSQGTQSAEAMIAR